MRVAYYRCDIVLRGANWEGSYSAARLPHKKVRSYTRDTHLSPHSRSLDFPDSLLGRAAAAGLPHKKVHGERATRIYLRLAAH